MACNFAWKKNIDKEKLTMEAQIRGGGLQRGVFKRRNWMKCEIRVSFSSSLFPSHREFFFDRARDSSFFRPLSLTLLSELNFPPLKIEDGSVEDEKFSIERVYSIVSR